MAGYSESLIKSLVKKVKEYPRFSKDEIEKFCWMAVHEHKHGVLPYEYDIREIDEDLYLELLPLEFLSPSLQLKLTFLLKFLNPCLLLFECPFNLNYSNYLLGLVMLVTLSFHQKLHPLKSPLQLKKHGPNLLAHIALYMKFSTIHKFKIMLLLSL